MVEKSTSKITVGLGAAVIILITILGIKWYLDHQEKQEMQAFYDSELEDQREKLAEISEELQDKIVEIEQLGGDIEELTETQTKLEAERDQLQRTRIANRKLIIDLRNKTEGYVELLKAKDEEIVQLKAVNEQLFVENTGLKEDKNQLSKSINELSEDKQKLQNKVDIAAHLKVEDIKIIAVNNRGKEIEGSFRNRQITNLKIEFNIAKNEVAPIEGKNVLLRISDGNGQVYFDVARGSGSFMLNGKEEYYTTNQEILFDNSNQKITFIYNKGSDYNLGIHTVEVFTDGYLMGKETFDVH